MDELERLLAQGEAIARTGERLSAVFAAELAQVWRRFERSVAASLASGASSGASALRSRVRRLLSEAGFDVLATAAAQAGVEQIASVVLASASLPRAALEVRLAALREMLSVDIFQQGDAVATAVWRAVSQSQFRGRSVADTIADLASALDRTAPQVETLFDTAVSVLGRQVEALKSEDLPDEQPFLYTHVIDFKTRPFCLTHAGKVFTRAAIDRLDNGQLPDVFLTGGGYNCRGAFLAVESKALRALANTGQRAPGYDGRIRAMQARKERKRAA